MAKAKLKQPKPYHAKEQCEGEFCCFHNPSNHHMVDWPMVMRLDKYGMMERVCEHGVGHPDPDSLAWVERSKKRIAKMLATTPNQINASMHGCDGCCSESK